MSRKQEASKRWLEKELAVQQLRRRIQDRAPLTVEQRQVVLWEKQESNQIDARFNTVTSQTDEERERPGYSA